jgi:hypothetical protein
MEGIVLCYHMAMDDFSYIIVILVDSGFSKWQLPLQITVKNPNLFIKYETNCHSLVIDVKLLTPEQSLTLIEYIVHISHFYIILLWFILLGNKQ